LQPSWWVLSTQHSLWAYQAIPPESSFYTRLQHDRALMILSIELFYSGYLFNLFSFEDDPEEFDEYMENLIEGYPDVFCGDRSLSA
jgi:hypothetical protein